MKTSIKRILGFILTFCLVLSLTAVSFADTVSVPEAPGGVYVLDEAEVLDLDSENALNNKSEKLKTETGLDFYIVTVSDKGGAILKDYTYAVYDSWKIGGSEDKGLILVLDIENDDYYLKPGDAIREVYTGTVLQGYLDTYLEGDFATGNYGDGAAKLHDAISTLGRRSFTIEEPESESESEVSASESETESAPEDNGGGFWGFIGGLFKVILVIFLILAAFVIIINIRGQMVKKKRREARAAARRQRQTQRKSENEAPAKPVKAIDFDDDFEEIESSSEGAAETEEEEISDFEDISGDDLAGEDDEFIISAFDEILAKKQNGGLDSDDIDLDDGDEDFEDEEE